MKKLIKVLGLIALALFLIAPKDKWAYIDLCNTASNYAWWLRWRMDKILVNGIAHRFDAIASKLEQEAK